MDGDLSEDIRALIERTRRLAESSRATAEAARKLASQSIADLANFRADAERAKQRGLDGNENTTPRL